jgi:hypothetical protein
MPVPDLPGTGYVSEDWSGGRTQVVQTSFGPARMISAEVPDVAFVHADLADADGNATIRGLGHRPAGASPALEQVVPGAEDFTAHLAALGVNVARAVPCPDARADELAAARAVLAEAAERGYDAAVRALREETAQ